MEKYFVVMVIQILCKIIAHRPTFVLILYTYFKWKLTCSTVLESPDAANVLIYKAHQPYWQFLVKEKYSMVPDPATHHLNQPPISTNPPLVPFSLFFHHSHQFSTDYQWNLQQPINIPTGMSLGCRRKFKETHTAHPRSGLNQGLGHHEAAARWTAPLCCPYQLISLVDQRNIVVPCAQDPILRFSFFNSVSCALKINLLLPNGQQLT